MSTPFIVQRPNPSGSSPIPIVNDPTVPVNAPPASTGSAIVHPASTVSAAVSSPPVSTVSTVNAPPTSTPSVAAAATVSSQVTQPPRDAWFRYTCCEVAVDKGAAESVRSTPDQLGLSVQRAVITKSSNLWDNGIVSLHFIAFTSTNNSFSRRPSLMAS